MLRHQPKNSPQDPWRILAPRIFAPWVKRTALVVLAFSYLLPLVAGLAGIAVEALLRPGEPADPDGFPFASMLFVLITVPPLFPMFAYGVFGLPAFLLGLYAAARRERSRYLVSAEIALVAGVLGAAFAWLIAPGVLANPENPRMLRDATLFIVVAGIAMVFSGAVGAFIALSQRVFAAMARNDWQFVGLGGGSFSRLAMIAGVFAVAGPVVCAIIWCAGAVILGLVQVLLPTGARLAGVDALASGAVQLLIKPQEGMIMAYAVFLLPSLAQGIYTGLRSIWSERLSWFEACVASAVISGSVTLIVLEAGWGAALTKPVPAGLAILTAMLSGAFCCCLTRPLVALRVGSDQKIDRAIRRGGSIALAGVSSLAATVVEATAPVVRKAAHQAGRHWNRHDGRDVKIITAFVILGPPTALALLQIPATLGLAGVSAERILGGRGLTGILYLAALLICSAAGWIVARKAVHAGPLSCRQGARAGVAGLCMIGLPLVALYALAMGLSIGVLVFGLAAITALIPITAATCAVCTLLTRAWQ